MRCSDIFMNVQEISPFYLRTTYLLPNPAQLFTVPYMHSISLINEGGILLPLYCGGRGNSKRKVGKQRKKL